MASTLKKQDGTTDMAVNTSVMTDKCVTEFFAGNITTAGTYRLVLLNLSLGALTITPTGTAFQYWAAISDAETATGGNYTKGTGLALDTPTITALSAHSQMLDFADEVLASATLTSDAYAIVRWVTSTADSPVLALGKWSATKSPAGVNFTVSVAGTVKITASDAA